MGENALQIGSLCVWSRWKKQVRECWFFILSRTPTEILGALLPHQRFSWCTINPRTVFEVRYQCAKCTVGSSRGKSSGFLQGSSVSVACSVTQLRALCGHFDEQFRNFFASQKKRRSNRGIARAHDRSQGPVSRLVACDNFEFLTAKQVSVNRNLREGMCWLPLAGAGVACTYYRHIFISFWNFLNFWHEARWLGHVAGVGL